MAFEKMTQQIDHIKKKREQYQLATLDVFSRYEQDLRRFYITIATIAGILGALSISQYEHVNNIPLYKTSLALLILTTILSVAQYINLLEKQSKKFFTDHNATLERQNREIYVLEKFKYGQIDTDEIRKYYTQQVHDLEKYIPPKPLSMLLAWFTFIPFAISLILLALAL